MREDFTGFVLAGGKSSRMGTDKFALRFEGESFLERAARTLAAVCAEVKIVLNERQSVETSQPIVRDVFHDRGANGGIHAALSNCATEFAVILAIDLPFVGVPALENLARIAISEKKFSSVVPVQKDGKPQPLCAVYRVRDCLPALEKLLSENERASVRDFLALIEPKYIGDALLGETANVLFNVNYPEDLQKLA